MRYTCLEEDLHVLAGRLLLEDGVRAFPHHVVDGLHDVQHLLEDQHQVSFSLLSSNIWEISEPLQSHRDAVG